MEVEDFCDYEPLTNPLQSLHELTCRLPEYLIFSVTSYGTAMRSQNALSSIDTLFNFKNLIYILLKNAIGCKVRIYEY
jgi:hypothetical protein